MKARQSGFTLVEVAIALLVVAILTAGGLRIIHTLTTLNNTVETRDRMARVRDALTGYFVRTGRLPCPADPTLADGAASAGAEGTITLSGDGGPICNGGGITRQVDPYDGTRITYYGTVPWAALGLTAESAYDSYGGRLHYMVSEGALYNAKLKALVSPGTSASTLGYGDTLIPTTAKISGSVRIANAGQIIGVSPTQPLGSVFAFAVLSHGPNDLGAYQSSGKQKPVVNMGASASESLNASPNANTLVEAPPPTEANATNFDDRLLYVSAEELINKATAAGTVPSAQNFFNAQVERFKQGLLPNITASGPTLETGAIRSLYAAEQTGLLDAAGGPIGIKFPEPPGCKEITPSSLTPCNGKTATQAYATLSSSDTDPKVQLTAVITVGDIIALAASGGILQQLTPQTTQSSIPQSR